MIPILVIILLLGLSLPQSEIPAQLILPEKKAVAFYSDSPPKIDGRVDDIWLNASVQEGFIQREPYQGEKATQDTRFYVLYDLDHIYFLFVMLDNKPADIPSRLLERDQQFYPYDNINFYLDTYNDQRKAFFFATNPAGVEKDGLLSENGDKLDLTWDAIFQVAARHNNFGWVAEFAIPFSSIRFTDDLKYQIWGFNAWRTRKENREISFWSPVDQNFQMYRLDKGGVLIGMQNIHSGQNLKLFPYFTARQISKPINEEIDLNLGVDIKYGITSDLTIDVTINPDFGQVEIDAEQINLDKRYEIQLEEKRPFFLENTNLFQTPYYQMFYSRRIGAQSDIKTGAKITGKLGSYSIGALGAFTGGWENYGLGDPSDPDPVDELFSVLRVQRDILASSNMGLMYVDRAVNLGGEDREYNKAGGLDVNLHSGQFYFIGQGIYSYNSDISKVKEGVSGFAEAGYYGQLFRLDAYTLYYSPDFDLEMTGYFPKIPEKGSFRNGLYTDIHPLINKRYVRSWGLSAEPFYFKDSDESNYSIALQGKAWLEFADQTTLRIGYTPYREVEADNYYYFFRTPLEKGEELVYWGRDIFTELTTDISKPVSLSIRWNYDSQYYFQTHTTGFNQGLASFLLLKPVSNAFIEFGFQNRRFLNPDQQYMPVEQVGQSNIQIWSVRSRYLFSKNIFSRVFFQYTNGAEDFGSDATGFYQYEVWKRMSANVLLGWRFRPGSTVYLAYTEEWDRRQTAKYFSANRILFFKFAYLWSL